jgi:hypothetical protein
MILALNAMTIFFVGPKKCREAGKWRPEMSNLRNGSSVVVGVDQHGPTRKNHRDFTGNAEDLWWIAQTIMPNVPTTYFIHLYTISVATLLVD